MGRRKHIGEECDAGGLMRDTHVVGIICVTKLEDKGRAQVDRLKVSLGNGQLQADKHIIGQPQAGGAGRADANGVGK